MGISASTYALSRDAIPRDVWAKMTARERNAYIASLRAKQTSPPSASALIRANAAANAAAQAKEREAKIAAAKAARQAAQTPPPLPSGAGVVVKQAVNPNTGDRVNVAVDVGTGRPFAAAAAGGGVLPPGLDRPAPAAYYPEGVTTMDEWRGDEREDTPSTAPEAQSVPRTVALPAQRVINATVSAPLNTSRADNQPSAGVVSNSAFPTMATVAAIAFLFM